jgi:hypothetical protein
MECAFASERRREVGGEANSPELGTDLVAALTSLEMDDFTAM